MTWKDVDLSKTHQEHDKHTDLQRACVRALDNQALRNYLEEVLDSASYTPGRDQDNFMYMEGMRALARRLIKLADQETPHGGNGTTTGQ